MSYPAISAEEADRVATEVKEALQNARDPLGVAQDADAKVQERGGADYDRSALDRFSNEIRSSLLPGVPNDGLTGLARGESTRLEAKMAGPIHAVLCDHEVACLQDPDFWRYLALFPLRWYAIAREPELQPQDYGGTTPVEASTGIEPGKLRKTPMNKQVVFRTFLWGKAAFDADADGSGPDSEYERATVLSNVKGGPSFVDVWHSHIIRPRLGHLGEVPRAFIDVLSSDPMPSNKEARELAKLLTRMKNTVSFDTYDYEEARKLVEEQLEFARRRLSAKNSPN